MRSKPFTLSALGALAVLAAAFAGCLGESVVGGAVPSLDGSNDLTIADDTVDVPVTPTDTSVTQDAPVVSDTSDAMTARCTSDAECVGNPAGAVCDVASGRCVQCTATTDRCPTGEICDPASNACVRGCRDDETCRAMGGGGDGGVTMNGRCNPMTRTCVDCVTDAHCGSGQRCVGNTCVMGCADTSNCMMGQVCCSGACVNTQDNTAHCGMCGAACRLLNAEARCEMGRCAVGECSGAFRNCDMMADNGCETDTQTSVMNCGGCGRICPAPTNARGTCAAGVCGIVCNEGFGDCDGNAENGCETDLNSTAAHCGRCMSACSITNGTAACMMGRCAVATCNEGFADCDMNASNGCEVDVRVSTTHCGMCARMCFRPANGSATCMMGRCGVGMCNDGFADCDGELDTGCEVNLASSQDHCGRCGNRCTAAAGGTVCSGGRCTITRCEPGRADCDMNLANGCETDIETDARHCGRCGNMCMTAAGSSACTAGRCVVGGCAPGRGDCDDNDDNGCETDTATNAMSCGSCGFVCRIPNGTAACRGGLCVVGTCNANFGDCDGDPSNGCETDLRTTVGHCGRCSAVCRVANGTPVCTAGTCQVGTCSEGFANCNMRPDDGCEVTITSDTSHCGRCSNVCPEPPSGSAQCRSGVCGIGACRSGTDDCDRNPANGCEVSTNTDVNNCGACARRCPPLANATVNCSGGVCGIGSCNPGFADCNGVVADGCEVNLSTTVTSCGRCGNVCSVANGTASCAGAVCGIAACNTGFGNCNGVTADGCETNLNTTATSCGRCGNACTAPVGGSVSCSSGSCVQVCPPGQSNCGGTCRPTGGSCTTAGSGGCQATGTIVCSGSTTACSGSPRTSGSCTGISGGVCNASGDCACPAGQTNCGGTCRNLTNDTNNCAACGRACGAPVGGSVSCSSSTCVQACPAGQSNCGGFCRATGATCTSAGSGGCQGTGSIVCSGTGTVCNAVPRTSGPCSSPPGGTCVSGTCTTVCAAGTTNCGGTCVNLTNDARNCGACGRACGSGQACAGSVCVGSGNLRFTMTWNRAGDMDLHVTPPCGTEIFYARPSACGGTLDRDDTSNTGPENIFWSSTPARGNYRVCVSPFRISGATNWTVNIYHGTTLVRTMSGTSTSSLGNGCSTTFTHTY